jgi:hexosaminidase
VQDNSHKIGRRWKGAFSDLETVYNFPPDTIPGLKNCGNQVLGIQANIWTEIIGDNKRLDFMTYPRLTALAESAWTSTEYKNYKSFLERLKPLLEYFRKENLYYYDPFTPDRTPEPAAPVKN